MGDRRLRQNAVAEIEDERGARVICEDITFARHTVLVVKSSAWRTSFLRPLFQMNTESSRGNSFGYPLPFLDV